MKIQTFIHYGQLYLNFHSCDTRTYHGIRVLRSSIHIYATNAPYVSCLHTPTFAILSIDFCLGTIKSGLQSYRIFMFRNGSSFQVTSYRWDAEPNFKNFSYFLPSRVSSKWRIEFRLANEKQASFSPEQSKQRTIQHLSCLLYMSILNMLLFLLSEPLCASEASLRIDTAYSDKVKKEKNTKTNIINVVMGQAIIQCCLFIESSSLR